MGYENGESLQACRIERGLSPRGLSARNVWVGRISSIIAEASGGVLVHVDMPAGLALSRITTRAAAELGIAEGAASWAIIKAHSM